MSNFFDQDGDLLERLISSTELSLLMIGENPTLSSAAAVMGMRKSLKEIQVTGLSAFDPLDDVFRCQSGFVKDKSSVECERIVFSTLFVSADADHPLSLNRSDPRSAQGGGRAETTCQGPSKVSQVTGFDATDGKNFIGNGCDIIFGHCVYPAWNGGSDPHVLLCRVLRAIQGGFAWNAIKKPVLAVFTFPDDDTKHGPPYKLQSLIEKNRHHWRYLGANKKIEETILRYGYLHERRMGPGYTNIHLLHHELIGHLEAHVFLFKPGNDS